MADVNGRDTTAYFETREAADAAVNDLEGAGIPKERLALPGRAWPSLKVRATAFSED